MPTTLLLLACLAAPPPCPGTARAADPGAPDVRVELEAVDGSIHDVPLGSFATDGAAGLDAVLIRISGAAAPPPLDQGLPGDEAVARLRLVGGDRLSTRVLGGKGEELQLELVGGVACAVPIDAIAELVFPGRLPRGGGVALERAPAGDRLYRRTGAVLDRIDGAIEGFDEQGVRFDSVLGTRTYVWAEVAAMFIDPFATEAPRPEGLPVVVDLVDGSRLRGGLRRLDAGGLLLATGRGADLLLPPAILSEIATLDGRIAFLSDLAPVRAEEGSPFGDELGLTWPHIVDRAVDGGPLRAGGKQYTRGLGVHAPSRLTWELDGGWSELRGRAALDDQVARLAARGSVIFRVFVDGEKRWESSLRRGGDAPLDLPGIDLAGARELVLEVDMADELHMGDRADWLRVLLVRAPR